MLFDEELNEKEPKLHEKPPSMRKLLSLGEESGFAIALKAIDAQVCTALVIF